MRRRIRRVRKGACGRRSVATLAPRPQAYLTDEAGQGLRPPKGRTWGRRGRTPVVTVTGGHDTRVSLAALIATRPGQRPRMIYRTHRARRGDKRKGFTETDYARFLDAAHPHHRAGAARRPGTARRRPQPQACLVRKVGLRARCQCCH